MTKPPYRIQAGRYYRNNEEEGAILYITSKRHRNFYYKIVKAGGYYHKEERSMLQVDSYNYDIIELLTEDEAMAELL